MFLKMALSPIEGGGAAGWFQVDIISVIAVKDD
jgi:hypothetical protein